MNKDMVTDLKQFIVAAVRQGLHDVARKSGISRLDAKIDDAIGDTMEAHIATVDEQIVDIRRQVASLKPKAA